MIIGRIAAACAVLLMACAALAPSSARAEWRKAESTHFVIYSDRSEAVLREYAVMMEDFDGLLRRMHGRPADEPVTRKLDIYLVEGIGQLRRVAPGIADRVGGFYYASPDDIFAVAIRDVAGGVDDPTLGDDVVFHEYVHHFMVQYFEAAHPPWLTEGYAEYYATTDVGAKRFTIGNVHPGRAYALGEPGGQLDITIVLTKRVWDLPKNDRGAFYAQSWFLTHYIMSDPDRRTKLKVYLREWREHGDSVKAWQIAYGQDPQALTRSLRNYRGRPLAGLALLREAKAPPPVTITRLSPGADAVLLELQQLKMAVPKARGADLLTKVRGVHARMPTDRFARLAASRAEVRLGDRAAGEAILQQMITDDPNDWEAMLLLAESRIVAGQASADQRKQKMAEAAKLLGAVSKIRPDDYRLYALYGQSRSGLAGEPSENTLNVLAKAVELAPQVHSLRLNAASAFMRGGTPDEVRHLLEPVANNPHGGRATTTARAMLAKLDGKEPPPVAESESEEEGE